MFVLENNVAKPPEVPPLKLWTALAELGIEEHQVHAPTILDESVYPADLARGTEFIHHGVSLVRGDQGEEPELTDSGYTLIYLGEAMPPDLRHPRKNEVFVAASCGWDELACRFAELSSTIARLSIRQDLLMRSFSRTTNLEWFVSRVAKIVGNPAVLVNTESKILATSRDFRSEAPNQSEDFSGGYISGRVVEEMNSDRIFSLIAQTRHAVVTHNERYDQSWAFSPLVLGSNTLGHLDVLERNRPFTPSDLELIDDASELLCVLVAYGGLGGSFAGSGSSVLADLVEGEFSTHEELEGQLALTVFPTMGDHDTYLLFTIVAGTESLLPGFRAHVAGMITSAFPRAIWSYAHGCFIVLDAVSDDVCAGVADYEGAEHYLLSHDKFFASIERCGLSCSAAEPFDDLLDVRSRFRQCSLLADAMLGAAERPSLVAWWRRRFDVLAHMAKGSELAEVLIDARVRGMARYDDAHHTSYLRTAAMSVRFPGAPTEAASALRVHRNTYFYRTGKIFELFNLDLKDGDDRLAIALAVHLVDAGLEL